MAMEKIKKKKQMCMVTRIDAENKNTFMKIHN